VRVSEALARMRLSGWARCVILKGAPGLFELRAKGATGLCVRVHWATPRGVDLVFLNAHVGVNVRLWVCMCVLVRAARWSAPTCWRPNGS
jgi:hypothetical protein